MLTGSGVALILRIPGMPADAPWSFHKWYVFAGVAGFSLLTKYVIRYRGSHLFNPSNIGLVVAFVVLGSGRVEPLDFWWAPLNAWMIAAYAVIIVGGLLITARLRLLDRRRLVLAHARGRPRVARRDGPLHDGAVGLRAGVRVRLLAGDRHLPGGADLPVLHDHRPEDGAHRAGRPVLFGVLVGVASTLLIAAQTNEFGTKVALLGGSSSCAPPVRSSIGWLPRRGPSADEFGRFAVRLAKADRRRSSVRRSCASR